MTNDPTPEKDQGATTDQKREKMPKLIIGLGGTGANAKEALKKRLLRDLEAREKQGEKPFLIPLDGESESDQKG